MSGGGVLVHRITFHAEAVQVVVGRLPGHLNLGHRPSGLPLVAIIEVENR